MVLSVQMDPVLTAKYHMMGMAILTWHSLAGELPHNRQHDLSSHAGCTKLQRCSSVSLPRWRISSCIFPCRQNLQKLFHTCLCRGAAHPEEPGAWGSARAAGDGHGACRVRQDLPPGCNLGRAAWTSSSGHAGRQYRLHRAGPLGCPCHVSAAATPYLHPDKMQDLATRCTPAHK